MNNIEALKNITCQLRDDCPNLSKEITSIKNSLKALEIIKKKKVDVDVLLNCKTLEDFNGAMEYTHNCKEFNLAQEEFDLIKKELEK